MCRADRNMIPTPKCDHHSMHSKTLFHAWPRHCHAIIVPIPSKLSHEDSCKHTVKSLIWGAPNHKTLISLVSFCSCLCAIYWSQVFSREWRCSWSSADRRCSNCSWLVNISIAYKGALYIRDLTVVILSSQNCTQIRKINRPCPNSKRFWMNQHVFQSSKYPGISNLSLSTESKLR